ncbi:pentapeptide repeat-containing protein, partial [Okeania sp. SIO2G5]|uniref:pentapeptide repeat-containing protein n=1 Tax=Okeania sp. SIO2G5 TaxID=2607796 RepID=UPI0013C16658
DSLAEGMVSSPANRGHKYIASSSELGYSGAITNGTPSSPSARLAAQIRARKNRKLDSTPYASRNGYPRAHHGTAGQSLGRSIGPSSHKASKSADSVLASYSRGRRNFASLDLSLLNFQQANLAGANFHQANFRQARLMNTNLQQANLGGANFGQARLRDATLKDANLAGAFLTNADLANADLRGANLSYAHLSNANLRGANLCGADLTGAKITDAQLAMARTNWKTIHPNKKRTLW